MRTEYPDSWYAASAPGHVPEAALEGTVDTDICVIGAGFTGLSAALTLAEAGRDVVVIEARRVGWGASGRNGGQLIHGFSGQDKMARHWGASRAREIKALTWAGHDLIRRRIDDYDIDCELTPGWLEVAVTARQLAALYHTYNELESNFADRGLHFMGAAELADTIGSDVYQGGYLSQSDGHLHPLKLCLGLYAACKKLGVRFFEESPVIAIDEGMPVTVHTEKGRVTARQLIVAANAHHGLMKRQFSGHTYTAGSFIIATEPLDAALRASVNPHRYAVCDTRKVFDYFRMSVDGRVLFGGRVNYSGRKPKSIAAKLRPRLLKVWPQLEGIKVSHEWGGKIAVAVGEAPLVGKIGDNIWYSYGYTGHGVNLGNLMGQILGEAIGGDMSRFTLFAGMPQRRIPVGDCIGRQAVASAIVYYRFRDLL